DRTGPAGGRALGPRHARAAAGVSRRDDRTSPAVRGVAGIRGAAGCDELSGVSPALTVASQGGDRSVRFGSAISIELPRVAHFLDQIEVQIRDDELVLVPAAFGDDAPARIAEVALAVELADLPRRFDADAVDRADEIAVGDRVRRLFQLPQVF